MTAHTCSSRSPSERPSASMLPFCPLTPGLTWLVLLHLMDAAEKVQKKTNTWNLCSVRLPDWELQLFHLSIQVYSDSTTDLFNDSNDLVFFRTTESFVSRYTQTLSEYSSSLPVMKGRQPPHTPLPSWKSDIICETCFFAHKSTFCQSQDRPPGGVYSTFSEKKNFDSHKKWK